MSRGVRGSARLSYAGTLALLALALAFPIALMVFNPTLMFERGWEQYVGTAIYLTAVLALTRELLRLRADDRAFADAPAMLRSPGAIGEDDAYCRVIAGRLRDQGHSIDAFSVQHPVPDGWSVDGTKLVSGAGWAGLNGAFADLAGIGTLRGRHNAQNALAAGIAALRLGIRPEQLAEITATTTHDKPMRLMPP